MPLTPYKLFDTSKVFTPKVVELSWFGFAENPTEMTREQLLEKLSNLPSDTEELDLSANQFGLCDLDFLFRMFESVKQKLSILNLSFNQFNKMNPEHLGAFLAKLPSVQHLILSDNHLYDYSLDQYMSIFKALPASVISIDMTYTLKNDINIEVMRTKLHEEGITLDIMFDNQHINTNASSGYVRT